MSFKAGLAFAIFLLILLSLFGKRIRPQASEQTKTYAYLQTLATCECYRKGLFPVDSESADRYKIALKAAVNDPRYTSVTVHSFPPNRILLVYHNSTNMDSAEDPTSDGMIQNATLHKQPFLFADCTLNGLQQVSGFWGDGWYYPDDILEKSQQ